MSAVAHEARLCACGWEHLCACGCGNEINANVRRAHELVAAGATHRRAAEIIGVSREAVSIWHKKPPKYLVGHHRNPREVIDAYVARDRARKATRELWREKTTLKNILENLDSQRPVLVAHPERYNAKVLRKHRPDIWQRITEEHQRIREERVAEYEATRAAAKWIRIAVREQRAAMRLRDIAKRDLQRRVDREVNRGETSLLFAAVSLDAPLETSEGAILGSDKALAVVPSAEEEVMRDDMSTRLHSIVGDLDIEDVSRMTEWDLQRLRERLAAEGLAPDGVQKSERARLRDPARHSGATVGGGGGHHSQKTRKQKIEHKAANRARGNSNRPAQKPQKRWERAQRAPAEGGATP